MQINEYERKCYPPIGGQITFDRVNSAFNGCAFYFSTRLELAGCQGSGT